VTDRPDLSDALQGVVGSIRDDFEARHTAREAGLTASRKVIQHSANSIRAMHRHEFEKAESLLGDARARAGEAQSALRDFPEIYHAGFIHDALKEYAEASITLALVTGRSLPTPEEIDVEFPAYLNGLAEAVGEIRRYTLDAMRNGEAELPEKLLAMMDEIYSQLVTIDFPDAITRGLRRHTDMVRGVTEKTRGDLTLAAMNRRLEDQMAGLRQQLADADAKADAKADADADA
jgi:translin